jgi:hypothetical protein
VDSVPSFYANVKITEAYFWKRDLKAMWHGLYGHLLGFMTQYLLSGYKGKVRDYEVCITSHWNRSSFSECTEDTDSLDLLMFVL